jgi:hypothetical protein
MVLGTVTGGNLVMDPNEIQARVNGAATTLRLQQDGGSLLVQGGALTVGTNGFVGIGDLTPDAPLHVAGDGLFNALNPTIQLQNEGVDKGFIQLSGNNIRIGTNSSNLAGHFVIRTGGGDRVFVNQNGNVGIGTGPVNEHRLAVQGSVICEQLKVELVADWPDYVFSDSYDLTPLSELKDFINTHHHLPNIPSASEVMKDGIDVGEMHRKLLEKVEELTLYLIEKDEQIEKLKTELELLKNTFSGK